MVKSRIVILSSAIALIVASGCAPERPSESNSEKRGEQSAGANLAQDGRSALPVAEVDGETISLGDLERRISGMAPYARVRYSTTEQREELLQSVIIFEVLADEAERRGLDDDPEVIHEMKEAMIRRLLIEEERKRVSPSDITDAEIAAYYNEHNADYHTDEQRRALVVKVRTEKFARELHEKLVAEASKEPDDQKRLLTFRKFSARHSIERTLSQKGGDIGFLPPPNKLRNNKEISRRVFELENIADFSEPYLHESVWHIVMLMDKRPARTRSLEGVSGEIRQTLYESRRKKVREELIEGLKGKAKIEVNQANLEKLQPPKGDSQILNKALEQPSPVRDLVPKDVKKPRKEPVEEGDKQENP